MAFPTTGILDTFTGLDETSPPNSNWTNLYNGLKITSNAVSGNTTTNYNAGYYNVSDFGPDCEAYFTIVVKPPDNASNIGVVLRIDTTNLNAYIAKVIKGSVGVEFLALVRIDGGAETELDSIETAYSVGDKVGISAIGNILTLWHCPVGTGVWGIVTTYDITSDTPKYTAAGKIGIVENVPGSSFARVDDFGGGAYVPPPAGVSRGFMTTMSKFWG